MKTISKMLALLLALTCCIATASVAFAAEVPEPQTQEVSVTEESGPVARAILGYGYKATSGNSGNFPVSTSSATFYAHQCSIKLEGYGGSGHKVNIRITDKDGRECLNRDLETDQYHQNIGLNFFKAGETYNINYTVYDYPAPSGVIQVWFF